MIHAARTSSHVRIDNGSIHHPSPERQNLRMLTPRDDTAGERLGRHSLGQACYRRPPDLPRSDHDE